MTTASGERSTNGRQVADPLQRVAELDTHIRRAPLTGTTSSTHACSLPSTTVIARSPECQSYRGDTHTVITLDIAKLVGRYESLIELCAIN
jgi:hypothetical protein